MSTFHTWIITNALGAKAVAICDTLGYPEKGMFTATIRTGPEPANENAVDNRPVIAYVSSGYVDDDCPLLSDDPDLLLAACKARAESRGEVSKITKGDCVAVLNAMSKGEFNPLPEMASVKAKGRVDKWVKPDPVTPRIP